jgi:hypothetical protein
MIRKRLGVVPLLLAALLFTPTGVNAMVLDPYNSAYWDNQDNNCQCIAASVRMELMYVTGTTNVTSQSTLNAYAQAHDNGSYTCGSDPQGWAYALWNYSPAGYGFNYYVSSNQATQDWEIVYGLRADQHPNGALVAGGTHAVDVVGFYTLNDPWADMTQSLYGFYLLDPWYGRGSSGLPNWPYNGFSPNYYVTIGNWNSLYFTDAGTTWHYTVVLRSATDAAPHQPPPQSYGDYRLSQLAGPIGASASGARTLASPTDAGNLRDAVTQGLQQNALDQGGALGIDLTGYVVGRSVHVDSLAEELPSYDLVEIDVAGQVRAVAMVSEGPRGYSFAGLTPWTGRFDLASPGAIQSDLASQGMTGPGRLVWAWTEEGGSPFAPMIEAKDAVASTPAYLSITGRHDQLHLVPGLTAR